jgi:hypothetical protein
MKLIAYHLGLEIPQLRPAPVERPWMEATTSRFAYRCLPLNIANQYGWELLSPVSFEAEWDGGDHTTAIKITQLDDGWPEPMTHFGHGVLTFHVNCLFRTDPEVQLMVTGPINRPKDGIYPLSGIIETDWSHYTFTMNWLFTRPFHPVRFHKGEPIAHIMPVSLPMMEAVEPEIRALEQAEPDRWAGYQEWQVSRNAFNQGLAAGDPKVLEEKWQRGYFRGIDHTGAKRPEHFTKVAVKPFPKS